jgi:putative transposase
MAMDHAALLEVLDAMKPVGAVERIRLAATTIYQALIDAELTWVIGAGPGNVHPGADGAAERLPTAGAVDPGGDLELSIPKLRSGRSPVAVVAAASGGSGFVCGGDGGFPARCVARWTTW